jgi:septum formation protein
VRAPLLLASNSPRRRALLTQAGFEFEAASPKVAEKFDVDLTLRELTTFNALRKARWALRKYPDRIVLAADTLVALDREIIGKPANLTDARKILRRLSGRIHEVCSAVFVGHYARSTIFVEISRVRFRRLSEGKIDNYFSKVDPLDKAGAYAAQGDGGEIIAEIKGSFSNVVGLPMEKTTAVLREFQIKPRAA